MKSGNFFLQVTKVLQGKSSKIRGFPQRLTNTPFNVLKVPILRVPFICYMYDNLLDTCNTSSIESAGRKAVDAQQNTRGKYYFAERNATLQGWA